MAIEDTLQPATQAINSFLNIFAIDLEKFLALLIIIGLGGLVAKYGRKIIVNIMEQLLKNEWVQKHSRLTVKDLKEPKGWKVLLLLIPNLVRIFILFFFFIAGLNVLEFDEASEQLGLVWAFFPNIIVFVVFVIIGKVIIDTANEIMLKEKIIVAGKSTVAKYAFDGMVWFIVLSIGFTQLQIGEDVFPIILGGIMGSIIVAVYGVRNIVSTIAKVEAIKSMGVKVGDTIKLRGSDIEYTIKNMGLTHLQVVAKNDNALIYFIHEEWMNAFSIKPTPK